MVKDISQILCMHAIEITLQKHWKLDFFTFAVSISFRIIPT